MSTQGIGALERGDRRTPQRETVALLVEALDLGPEQRIAFEAAAFRPSVPRSQRALDAAPLPVSLTSFVGRESEVEEIAALVREHRLVTLIGPGGIGKTRASLDVARVLSSDFPDAVRFVELAPLGDSELVANAFLASFNLSETPNRSPLDTLLAHLQRRRVLLIVDNCEHVIAEVAREVERLLRGCPHLKIFATSREPLRVPGEQVYRVPALAAPSLEACESLTASAAAQFPAIRLFADRALSADRTFVLDDDRAPVVAEICARVDGIPLAIELAAARVTALSLSAMAVNLQRRFTLLGGGIRTATSRQQTMHAAIDWSFDLLDESERRLFACLSVFAGGCTIDAIVGVAGNGSDDDAEQFRIFDLLSSLIDKSLVIADVSGDVPRYRMLESFRQYAREKLVESGEFDRVSRCHARTFLQRSEQLRDAMRLQADGAAVASARLDLDNWRAALEWCLVGRNDVLSGQRIVSNLRLLWDAFRTVEGITWVRLALEVGGTQTPLAVTVQLERTDAMLSVNLGEFAAALAAAERAVAHARTLGDEVEVARAEVEVANALVRLGKPAEAEPHLRSALAYARENGLERFAVKILLLAAEARAALGDFAEARAACTQARAVIGQATGRMKVVSFITSAEIEFRAGDAEAALHFTSEALRHIAGLRESESADSLEAAIHANASAYLISLARYDEARARAREALQIAMRRQFRLEHVWALQHLAAIAVLRPHPGGGDQRLEAAERCARLVGFVSKRYDELGAAMEPTERQEFDRILEALHTALDAERLTWLQTRGATMNDDEATAEALGV